MPDKNQTPRDLDTLTWGYLDGDVTAAQVSQLEEKLLTSESARETFVEHSQLHAMLHDFFRTTRAQPAPAEESCDTAAAPLEPPARKRKRRGGKSSAA
ncbi:hypothetical protein OT109_03260 [Phycisphaeraceae bacterium D3-23]